MPEVKRCMLIGQSKTLKKQKIPEFSRARKETVDMDILQYLGMVTEKSCNLSE